jgi:RNA polymerase sigma-70 factor (ECF subfamily)
VKLIQLKHIDKWSEETLIQECIKNNEKAQRHLFETHQARMFAVCMRYLDNEDEGFDVLNQSFLKIFNKVKHLEGSSKLEAWIRRIVVNTALDYIRKNKSYRKVFVKADDLSHFKNPNHETDDISEWWANALKIPQERLFLEINLLPKASRLVFNLYVIDDLKHKEIANQLGINESTSRWHLSNAREILKERVIDIINKEINNGPEQQQKY